MPTDPLLRDAVAPHDPDRLVTAQQLADRLQLSRATIYALMREGLPSIRLGRARRFRVSDVDRWLDDHQGGEAA